MRSAGRSRRSRADRGGLIDIDVQVSLSPGWHTAVLRSDGTEPAEARIFVIGPDTKFGIVSDIDDTVMVTALPRPFLALWNTFVLSERARMATPGMAVLLDRLTVEHPDAPVIYLSTGPWNAAPTLAGSSTATCIPSGALLLTDWGLTQDRWFRSGQDHKHRNLERLAAEFPDMRWLLIGDNGQHDEQIYSAFAQEHADKVAAIAIRQLSVSESVLAGGHSEDGDHSASAVPWIYSPDGAGMARQLKGLELHLTGAPTGQTAPEPWRAAVGHSRSPHRPDRRRQWRREPRPATTAAATAAPAARHKVPLLEELLKPVVGRLRRTLQRLEVHVQQPERLVVAAGPLEIVHQGPHVVAAKVDRPRAIAAGGRGLQRGPEVVRQVSQAPLVRDERAVGGFVPDDDVLEARPALGDDDGRKIADTGQPFP